MKNREFYAEQILNIVCCGAGVAVDKETNKPCQCEGMSCSACALLDERGEMCRVHFAEWCDAEYVEPRPFEKDELVEVSNDELHWHLRYFSHIDAKSHLGKFVTFDYCETSKTTTDTVIWKYCRKYGTLGGLVKGETE